MLNTERFNKIKNITKGYSVRYILYKDEHPKPRSIAMPDMDSKRLGGEKVIHNMNSVCFAELSQLRLSHPKTNCIAFKFHKKAECGLFEFTDTNRKKFLMACKKHKMLPNYVSVNKVIKLSRIHLYLNRHNRNQLYIYLTVVRQLQENPVIVAATLELMSQGMNFLPAYILSAKVEVPNSNHHFLPQTECKYIRLEDFDINNEVIALRTLVGLYKILTIKGEYNINGLPIPKDLQISRSTCCKELEAFGNPSITLTPNLIIKNNIDVWPENSSFKTAYNYFKNNYHD